MKSCAMTEGVRGRDRGKAGSLRDQNLSKRHRAHSSPRMGACLRGQGLGWARLKVFLTGEDRTATNPFPISSLALR